MGNLQKVTKGGAFHSIQEIERTPDLKREFDPEKHKIDKERTHLNYSLTGRDLSGFDYLEKRLKEVKVQNRADVKAIGQWVWTMPQDLAPKYQRAFFQEVYNYYASKFGAENICYAQVHLDETTPHLHIGVIPVVKLDKARKDGKTEKVSAKEVFTRAYLQREHSLLQTHIASALGTEVNLINGKSMGAKGVRNYAKARELAAQVAKLEKEKESLKLEIGSLTGQKAELEENLKEKKSALEALVNLFSAHPNIFESFLSWINRVYRLKLDKTKFKEYNDAYYADLKRVYDLSQDDGRNYRSR